MTVYASPAERLALLAAVIGTANSTPLLTSWVTAKNAGQLLLVVALGDMAAETIDISIQQATSSGGAGAKNLKAAVQLASSAGANDSKQVIIGVDANDLDVDGGFSFVAGRVVTGGATGGTVGILVFGEGLRYMPGSLVDNASVVQVVP